MTGIDTSTPIDTSTALDESNYSDIAGSGGEFSITNDAGDTQSIDGEGNYNWTTGDSGKFQSFQINDDGSAVRRNADGSATTIGGDGDVTLRGADGTVIQTDGKGDWTVDGVAQEGAPAASLLGAGGRTSGDGTFDITHADGSREFLTADGIYGYTDTDGNKVQIDGGGGFIHEDADGNSLWKSPGDKGGENEIGQTLDGYSGFLDGQGANQIGSYVPYAGVRDGFVGAFDTSTMAAPNPLDHELDHERFDFRS